MTTNNQRPEAPGAGQTHVLREAVSRAGRTVQLTQDQGTYIGAKPYYTVALLKPSGSVQAVRYTPFLTRAEFLFEWFARDITDPAKLGKGQDKA
jgi:hypothetical protein